VILALETATPYGSVALVAGGAVVRETALPAGRQASETVLSAVSDLFGDCGVPPGKVACVAVSAGPGSFTGLRVGMAAAKGFCFGWDLPLVLVPTLAALASRAPVDERIVCPVLDARKKEVYAAFFRWEGNSLTRLSPDMALPPEALLDRLPDGGIVFCGDGLNACRELVLARLGDRAATIEGPAGLPTAGAIGILGERAFQGGAVEDPRSAVPAYIRPSEAEYKRLLSRRGG
jgi:tRNA threonylcarbamoyladenosine biosynthesis protein TsaB